MKNGQLYFDTNGNHINAHGGSLLEHNGVWYWYGEHKTPIWILKTKRLIMRWGSFVKQRLIKLRNKY